MSSSSSQLEQAVFQSIRPQLEAEGYQVFVHPPRAMLPAFLSTYQPDAIALRPDRKIAIEVMSEVSARRSEQRLRELFSGHPDWELRVIYAPPYKTDATIPVASQEEIAAHLDRITSSLATTEPSAALLVAWAVFEAAARRLLPSDFGRPQSPSRLLEILATEGYITPDEAGWLRELASIRNMVAHGRLDVRPTLKQVSDLLRIAKAMLEFDH